MTIKVADIYVLRGVTQRYSYLVNTDECHVNVGDMVDCPLGKATVKGIIGQFSEFKADEHGSFKYIIQRSASQLSLRSDLIQLIEWMVHTYRMTPHKAIQTVLGSVKKRRPVTDDDVVADLEAPYSLTDAQQQVFDSLLDRWKLGFSVTMLQGVTGSGKTEIYMQLAATVIAQNKQVILLIPEISLTPQFTDVFTRRFGPQVAVLHSGLTPKQKECAWAMIDAGQISIVIGPRSAIFAPVPDLGLVIVDEEHDSSYKQDNHPRYLAHDIAAHRCQLTQSMLVLGSATPMVLSHRLIQDQTDEQRIESWRKDIFHLSLKDRVHQTPLPQVEIIDMKTQRQDGQVGSICSKMIDQIQGCLDSGKKCMILVNRRGYAPQVICQQCQTYVTCSGCGLGYVYHQDRSLRCHRCDTSIRFPRSCPSCQKDRLAVVGVGIQKVELELKQYFPAAHISRLDRDMAKSAVAMDEILTDFKDNGDILLGTQMIAKGHHIRDVHFVGVIGIDTVLHLPDFRSAERTFQLLTQVAGRCGRDHEPGQVMVQTFCPDHYAITRAAQHDVDGFIDDELGFRQGLGFPPFSRLVHIIMTGPDLVALKKYAHQIHDHFHHVCQDNYSDTEILGPHPASVDRIRNQWRWNIILKIFDSELEPIKKGWDEVPKGPSSVRVLIDFDPWQLI